MQGHVRRPSVQSSTKANDWMWRLLFNSAFCPNLEGREQCLFQAKCAHARNAQPRSSTCIFHHFRRIYVGELYNCLFLLESVIHWILLAFIQLLACCTNAEKFPIYGSVLGPNTNEDTLHALFAQLEERKKVLFSDDETRAALHFWETDGKTTGLWLPTNLDQLN
jgi:hypothetical protein